MQRFFCSYTQSLFLFSFLFLSLVSLNTSLSIGIILIHFLQDSMIIKYLFGTNLFKRSLPLHSTHASFSSHSLLKHPPQLELERKKDQKILIWTFLNLILYWFPPALLFPQHFLFIHSQNIDLYQKHYFIAIHKKAFYGFALLNSNLKLIALG